MYSTLILLLFATGAYADDCCFRSPINRFSNVVVFGDSYSDTGNLYQLTDHAWPIDPPYYHGRFCDGPNWVDNLNVLRKTDYAYGGATTDNNIVPGYIILNTLRVPGIRQQVATYLNDTLETLLRFLDPVYFIWGGGDDFILDPNISPLVVVNSLLDSVRDLLAIGAKNIIVFNSPPAQALPYNSILNQTLKYTLLTEYINTEIYTNLQALQANYTLTSKIHLFDLNAFITNIIHKPPREITNVVNNCWTAVGFTTVIQNCTDPKKYLFLDTLHFSSTVQKMIAEAIQPFFHYCYKENAHDCYIHSF
jgi:phospholipase/lecithinase/hemolysin